MYVLRRCTLCFSTPGLERFQRVPGSSFTCVALTACSMLRHSRSTAPSRAPCCISRSASSGRRHLRRAAVHVCASRPCEVTGQECGSADGEACAYALSRRRCATEVLFGGGAKQGAYQGAKSTHALCCNACSCTRNPGPHKLERCSQSDRLGPRMVLEWPGDCPSAQLRVKAESPATSNPQAPGASWRRAQLS